MSTEVDICNLALSHLGDDATVSSIDPPEGSAQAEHCQRFYPIARDELQEMHDWKFITRREVGAPVDVPTGAGWQYAYGKPNKAVRIIAVLPPDAQDDYNANLQAIPGYAAYNNVSDVFNEIDMDTRYAPQDFAVETTSTGDEIILTNQAEAIIRFAVKVSDPAKFSPLYTVALSRLLASYLAGPVIKGDEGRKEGKAQYTLFLNLFYRGAGSDARQQQIRPRQNVPWIQQR